MAMVKSTNYTAEKTILVAPELAFTLPIKVTNTGISADSDGKKILYAGQPIYGDITARETAFVKATTTKGENDDPDTSNANAIILHTVDVTDGAENATAVIFGFVDENKLDNVTITADEKVALSKITFVK